MWFSSNLMQCNGIFSSSSCFPVRLLKIPSRTAESLTMAPLLCVLVFISITSVSTNGFALDAMSLHTQCESDHQCDNGFFCYEESHLCTRCVECSSYKRQSSWRSCPKTPSDCGACLSGHEEEILHEGKTRDMCIQSFPNNLSHTIVPEYSFVERIFWAGAVTALILPIIYYVFTRKIRIRDRGTIHHDLHREEPPPYVSMELTTLSSNNSEERLSDTHEMRVGQQKDQLVQAVPFQKPTYMEEELLAFDDPQGNNSEETHYLGGDEVPVTSVSSVELLDENTMPSDWTPDENSNSGQLMSFELPDSMGLDEAYECEPAAKRHKAGDSQDSNDDESNNSPNVSINLIINNNVTIHKPY